MRLPSIVAFFLLAAGPAAAADRPVVVELFTSQSCSSCPPAEALLGRLAQEGAEVLPLAFHVTYWNHLDWRDAYALPEATARQEAYAARRGEATYTPEAVVDGRGGMVGSDEDAVRAAIARARAGASSGPPVSLTRSGAGLAIRVGDGTGTAAVTLVGFDPVRTTRVARGENAGRTIVQANVVRSVREIGRWSGAPLTLDVPVPQGENAAILLQTADGRILGAARLVPGAGS